MKVAVIASIGLMLAACGESPRSAEYDQYRSERTVVRVCYDGTRVWAWHGKLWVSDTKQWPDMQISAPLKDVCT